MLHEKDTIAATLQEWRVCRRHYFLQHLAAFCLALLDDPEFSWAFLGTPWAFGPHTEF